MEIIYLLVPLAAVLAALIAWGLLWAIRTGQFDDLDRPGHEVLWDDPPRRDDAVVRSAAETALPPIAIATPAHTRCANACGDCLDRA